MVGQIRFEQLDLNQIGEKMFCADFTLIAVMILSIFYLLFF